MIGLLKNKSQYYTEIFFYLKMMFSTQEFFVFTQELIHFTQEILTQEIANTLLKKSEWP